MKVAFFEIAYPILRDFLHLPDGVEIVAATASPGESTLRLYVSSPEFPEVSTLFAAPEAQPSFETIYHPTVEFVGWNLRE